MTRYSGYHLGSLKGDSELSYKSSENHWVIGNFPKFDELPDRKTKALEIKFVELKHGQVHHEKIQRTATEFTYVVRGKLSGWVGKEHNKVEVSEGDYIVIHPGTPNNIAETFIDRSQVLTVKVPSDPEDKKKHISQKVI